MFLVPHIHFFVISAISLLHKHILNFYMLCYTSCLKYYCHFLMNFLISAAFSNLFYILLQDKCFSFKTSFISVNILSINYQWHPCARRIKFTVPCFNACFNCINFFIYRKLFFFFGARSLLLVLKWTCLVFSFAFFLMQKKSFPISLSKASQSLRTKLKSRLLGEVFPINFHSLNCSFITF